VIAGAFVGLAQFRQCVAGGCEADELWRQDRAGGTGMMRVEFGKARCRFPWGTADGTEDEGWSSSDCRSPALPRRVPGNVIELPRREMESACYLARVWYRTAP
jgi:hypothetical protein